ncbi:hypothetical protein SprV_0401671100 [Sparganum proliferum]
MVARLGEGLLRVSQLSPIPPPVSLTPSPDGRDILARRQLSPALKVVKRIFYAIFDDDFAIKDRKKKVPLCSSKLYELITGWSRWEHADLNDLDYSFNKRLERSLDAAGTHQPLLLAGAAVDGDAWSTADTTCLA